MLRYLKTNKLFYVAIFISIVFWFFALAHPYVFRWYAAIMVKGEIPAYWKGTVEISGVILIILAISAFIFRFIAWAIMDISGEIGSGNILYSFADRLFNRNNLSIAISKKIDLKRVLSRDFYSIRSGLMAAIGDNIGAILELIIALVAILYIDFRLVLVFIPMVGVFLVFNRKILKELKGITVKEASSLDELLHSIQDVVNFRLETCSYNIQGWINARLKNKTGRWTDEIKNLANYQSKTYALQAITSRPILIGVLFFTAVNSHNADIPIEVLGAIISSLFMLNSALAQLGFTFNQFVVSQEALNRFYQVDEDLGVVADNTSSISKIPNLNLKINNLVVSRKRSSAGSLSTFTYNAEVEGPGIALVTGPSGFGKSTLMMAVVGLIPYKGEVTLSKINISSSRQWLKDSLFGYLPEKTPGFQVRLDKFLPENYAIHFKGKINYELDALNDSERHLAYSLKLLSSSKPIIIFDEPISVMNDKELKIFKEVLKSESKKKLIFIVSHQEVECDKKIKISDICEVNNYD